MRKKEKRKMVDAAAANLEWLGLNLRRMNRGGLNHVTYYEPEKKRGGVGGGWSGGGNKMDKGSNEAERERGSERKEVRADNEERGKEGGEVGGEGEKERYGVESRKDGGRGEESEGMCLAASFSHAPSVLVR